MVKEEKEVREDVLRTFWVCLTFMTSLTSFTSPDPLFPFLQ
jgi:hypothetical protein